MVNITLALTLKIKKIVIRKTESIPYSDPLQVHEIWLYMYTTRAVMVFVTELKNNVDPRLRSQEQVNYVVLFFALII